MYNYKEENMKDKTKNIKYIHLNNLHLDFQNPRLPESFRKNLSDEEDIIYWMLQDASIIELMLSIGQNGFFIGEALLVVKEDSKYIVVEGNRRLTALKLLQNPSLAQIHTRKIQKVLDETNHREESIPCLVFNKREEILQYLGYKHITGIKPWSMLSKARYLHSLVPFLESKILSKQARELAKKIGSRSDYVKRVLVSYYIYEIIKDNGFYNIYRLDETTFSFNYIAESLRYENIKKFINVHLDNETPLKSLDAKKLEILIQLFFEKNRENRSRVSGNSDNLKKLNKIFSNREVTKKFINGLSLDDSYSLIEVDSGTFTQD